jgi:hypothetical protein
MKELTIGLSLDIVLGNLAINHQMGEDLQDAQVFGAGFLGAVCRVALFSFCEPFMPKFDETNKGPVWKLNQFPSD